MNKVAYQYRYPAALSYRAKEQVEIVLREVCAGLPEEKARRLHRELWDHYCSAMEECMEEGLIANDAHAKIVKELGWDVCLKIEKLKRRFGSLRGEMIHQLFYGRHPQEASRQRKNWRLMSFVMMPWYLMLMAHNMPIAIVALFFLSTMIAFSGRMAWRYWKLRDVKSSYLPRESEIKQRLAVSQSGWYVGLFFFVIYTLVMSALWFYSGEKAFLLGILVAFAINFSEEIWLRGDVLKFMKEMKLAGEEPNEGEV